MKCECREKNCQDILCKGECGCTYCYIEYEKSLSTTKEHTSFKLRNKHDVYK